MMGRLTEQATVALLTEAVSAAKEITRLLQDRETLKKAINEATSQVLDVEGAQRVKDSLRQIAGPIPGLDDCRGRLARALALLRRQFPFDSWIFVDDVHFRLLLTTSGIEIDDWPGLMAEEEAVLRGSPIQKQEVETADGDTDRVGKES